MNKKLGTPKLSDFALELPRTLAEFGSLANPFIAATLLTVTPGGDDYLPVMVLPGFGGDDKTSKPLRTFLALKGYSAYGWENGRKTRLI